MVESATVTITQIIDKTRPRTQVSAMDGPAGVFVMTSHHRFHLRTPVVQRNRWWLS
jgi:hypothetical protein